MSAGEQFGDARPAEQHRLSAKERLELTRALSNIPVFRSREQQQSLIDELAYDLSGDADSTALNAPVDAHVLVRVCAQRGLLHRLVDALEIVGLSSPREVERFARLVDEYQPVATFSPSERQAARVLLEGVTADPTLDPEQASGVERELRVAVEYLDADEAGLPGGNPIVPLSALEVAAHRADTYASGRLHAVIDAVARRNRVSERVDEVCRSLAGTQPALVADPGVHIVQASMDERTRDPAPPDGSDPDGDPDQPDPPAGGDDVRTYQSEVVATLAAATVPAIMGGLPPRNPNFTGRRAELTELRRALVEKSRAALLPQKQEGSEPHTLQGLGGIGKTQLAAEYARLFQSEYKLIWWIPSDDEAYIRRSLISLARRLHLAESEDQDYTIDRVLDELRLGGQYAPWLLVFDGADEPAMTKGYLPTGPGHVLVTSRNRNWLAISSMVELDVFEPYESLAFLSRGWDGLPTEDARTLAETLGHLPIALEQAVALHRETAIQFVDYLRLVRQNPNRLLREGSPAEYPRSLVATWSIAFDHLSASSPGAAALLELCAFLGPQPIAIPMLARGCVAPGLPEPLAATLRDEISLRQAIRELGSLALAQVDVARDLIKVHMLVQAVLKASMPDDHRAMMQANAHQVLAHASPRNPDRESTWPLHAQIAPHVLPSGLLESDDPQVLNVVLDQARYFFARGDYKQSGTLADTAVRQWRTSRGRDDRLTLVAQFHLGNALRAQGEYDNAREMNRDTLTRMEATLGVDDEYTLRIRNSITADYRLLGNFEQARGVDEGNVARCVEVLPRNDPLTLRAQNNLAVDYRLLGRFAEARELDEQTFANRLQVLGEESPEVLLSCSNLARDIYGFGDYKEAIRIHTPILLQFEPMIADHLFVLLARRGQSIFLRKAGLYAESLELAESVRRDTIRRLGPWHEHSLAVSVSLANSLRVTGDVGRAATMLKEASEQYATRFGESHPFTLACQNNLAIAWRSLGKVQEAAALDGRVHRGLAEKLGEDHPYTLCSASNVANNLYKLGENQEAHARSKSVLERSQRVRLRDHPYTLLCAGNVAIDLDYVGDHAGAAELWGKIVPKLREKLGPEHPDTVNVERRHRAECDIEVPPT